MAEQNIWYKIANIDYRVIYAIFIILVGLPLVMPLGVPMTVGDPVKNYAATIEGLEAGDVVLCYFSGYATMLPDIEPVYLTTWRMLLDKDVRLLILLTHVDSPIVIETHFNDVLMAEDDYGKVYGEDYMFFPYIDITEPVELAFAADMRVVFSKDTYGTSLDDLPVMAGVESAKDIDLLVGMAPETNVRRYAVPYDVKIIEWGSATGLLPFVPPFYDPVNGPIYGYVGGASQGGELEVYTGYFGDGVRYNDAKNLGVIGLVLMVVIANVADYMSKKGGAE